MPTEWMKPNIQRWLGPFPTLFVEASLRFIASQWVRYNENLLESLAFLILKCWLAHLVIYECCYLMAYLFYLRLRTDHRLLFAQQDNPNRNRTVCMYYLINILLMLDNADHNECEQPRTSCQTFV